MIGRVLLLLFIVPYMANRSDALICYSCGYLELFNGTKIPLTEDFGKIPFCNDFATSDSNTVTAAIGGCCAAFKLEMKDEQTGDTLWISRHGTASDEDETIWNGFDCGETTDKYVCKDEHIKDEGLDEDGTVCHCYDDLCNAEVHDSDTTTTTTTTKIDSTTTTSYSDAQRLEAVVPAVYFLINYFLKNHILID